MIQKKICGFKYDEEYIGTAEERAAKDHGDDTGMADLDMGTNVLTATANVGTLEMDWAEGDWTARTDRILKNISELRAQIKESITDEEREVFEDALKHEIAHLKRTNEAREESMRNLGVDK